MKSNSVEDVNVTKRKPATSTKNREQQIVSYAIDLAEQQILDGTVSTGVHVHFLKLGTEMYKLEQLKVQKEILLITAKADSVEQTSNGNEIAEQAIKALKSYESSSD